MTDEEIKAKLDESISNAFKLQAETVKLQAEAALFQKKAKWYEVVFLCGLSAATGAVIVKILG